MALPIRRREERPAVNRTGSSDVPQQSRRDTNRRLDPWLPLAGLVGDAFTPLADVEEHDDAYLIEVELPGVQKGDIDIEIADRRVSVRGERKEKERVGILRRRERTVGRFSYEVVLPGTVDESDVHASLDDGVLTIRVGKPADARPRRIPIG